MELTADDARNLAQAFRTVASALGNYRFNNWDALSSDQLSQLEADEWALLNYSSELVTKAVGLTLKESQSDLKGLLEATTQATAALGPIATVNKVLSVSGAMLQLGAAIASEDPGAIATAAAGVYTVINKPA
jgi:hypothetical protein